MSAGTIFWLSWIIPGIISAFFLNSRDFNDMDTGYQKGTKFVDSTWGDLIVCVVLGGMAGYLCTLIGVIAFLANMGDFEWWNKKVFKKDEESL